jgi:predicted secreted protein
MPIGPLTMFSIYVICWWVALFMVLPLGTTGQDQSPPTDGAQWGAPDKPDLKRKFITTTWVGAILWAVIMVVIVSGIIPMPGAVAG